ncbi:hypothetical protein [Faecalibacter macacae]|uniref:Uncharacterized protein n=1 Tax=Faecalibacter macacae TaxID=1859289 RepID=A0A3L9M7F4_9FLAO|nr:hypothetical protein [Faecalibacter macacae]RLZ09157.1 hypothetical protein EAH69_09095 [Faecalibacter macacae]
MSKYFKLIFGLSMTLFLLIQVQGFFDLGLISFILYIIEVIIFIAVVILILIGLYKWMNNPIRFHIIILGISSILLGLIIYKPFGLIDDKMIYGENLLFVHEEGVASCTSSFEFKKNGKYFQKSVCFGINRKVGNYTINNDTIYLDTLQINQYKYGVIHRKDSVLKMYLTHPKTAKDFEDFKLDSAQLQKKIEYSTKKFYKIYEINGI